MNNHYDWRPTLVVLYAIIVVELIVVAILFAHLGPQ